MNEKRQLHYNYYNKMKIFEKKMFLIKSIGGIHESFDKLKNERRHGDEFSGRLNIAPYKKFARSEYRYVRTTNAEYMYIATLSYVQAAYSICRRHEKERNNCALYIVYYMYFLTH